MDRGYGKNLSVYRIDESMVIDKEEQRKIIRVVDSICVGWIQRRYFY